MVLNRVMWWLYSAMSAGRANFASAGEEERNTEQKQDSNISTNTIKRDKTHSLSLFCPFAQRPPVDVHCTLITVARPVCIVLRCSHEDGWSQAGSKGKCEALVIVYRHEWMANGNDIDIASSCHHTSTSLIERHLERLKRLCICNETLRRESKFAEVAHCWSELESKWFFNFQLLSRRIGALTVGSKTFGDSACLGTFQRWHCKHNQNLRDTTVTEGQMMVWHSHQWSNVFEAKAFAVCPFTVLHLSCSVALSRSVRRTWHRSIVVIMQFLRLLVARIFEVYPLWSICCHV